MTEQEAASRGITIKKASLTHEAFRALCRGEHLCRAGAVKIIAEQNADGTAGRILACMLGAYASEFIWGGAALIEQELRVADVKQIVFPHPTVCELIRDCRLGIRIRRKYYA
ncbi:hypothetical protein MASR2M78_27560 [Treponema sp.]